MPCTVRGNLAIKVTVNDLRPLMVLYQKKDSEKVEKQSARWRKFLTEKKNNKKLCNSAVVLLVA